MVSKEDKKRRICRTSSDDEKGSLNKKINKIAVIGAGTIGASWATFFAMKGYKVNLQDVSREHLEEANEAINRNLESLALKDVITENLMSILDRVFLTTDLHIAVQDVEYVQESAFERYEIKKEIFAQLDSVCPGTVILASSSSGLLMSEIQKVTEIPQRCIIAHPFNPPHLMPLVELVGGEKTSEETLQSAYRFFVRMGKTPIRLRKEVPGHIANRLSAALWREAIDLVCKGVASVEDVDLAICRGPGLRWALMGPHLTYHLGGGAGGIERFIEQLGPAFQTWWESMDNRTSISPLAARKIAEGIKGEIGARSLRELCQWRDDRLLAILKVLSDSAHPRSKKSLG